MARIITSFIFKVVSPIFRISGEDFYFFHYFTFCGSVFSHNFKLHNAKSEPLASAIFLLFYNDCQDSNHRARVHWNIYNGQIIKPTNHPRSYQLVLSSSKPQFILPFFRKPTHNNLVSEIGFLGLKTPSASCTHRLPVLLPLYMMRRTV